MKKLLLFMTLASVFVGVVGCGCGGLRHRLGWRPFGGNECCAPACSDFNTQSYYDGAVIQGESISPVEISPGPAK